MKPFIVLLVVFFISLIITKVAGGVWDVMTSGNIAMGVMLLFTAVAHFKFKDGMEKMVPAFIPFKKGMVIFTGIFEIVAGICLFFPATRFLASLGLIIFFIAVLPANIHAAIKHVDYERNSMAGKGTSYLWFRVPLQVLFIGWVFYFGVMGVLIDNLRSH